MYAGAEPTADAIWPTAASNGMVGSFTGRAWTTLPSPPNRPVGSAACVMTWNAAGKGSRAHSASPGGAAGYPGQPHAAWAAA